VIALTIAGKGFAGFQQRQSSLNNLLTLSKLLYYVSTDHILLPYLVAGEVDLQVDLSASLLKLSNSGAWRLSWDDD
jgi:hypothetical protein